MGAPGRPERGAPGLQLFACDLHDGGPGLHRARLHHAAARGGGPAPAGGLRGRLPPQLDPARACPLLWDSCARDQPARDFHGRLQRGAGAGAREQGGSARVNGRIRVHDILFACWSHALAAIISSLLFFPSFAVSPHQEASVPWPVAHHHPGRRPNSRPATAYSAAPPSASASSTGWAMKSATASAETSPASIRASRTAASVTGSGSCSPSPPAPAAAAASSSSCLFALTAPSSTSPLVLRTRSACCSLSSRAALAASARACASCASSARAASSAAVRSCSAASFCLAS